MSPRAKILIVAPMSFGAAAEEFAANCQRALGDFPSSVYIVGKETGYRLPTSDQVPRGSLIVGGVATELGMRLAKLAVDVDGVHLEVGALSGAALGQNSLRLTGDVGHTVAIASAAVPTPSHVLAESSEFGRSVTVAWKRIHPSFEVTERCSAEERFAGVRTRNGDILVAIARSPIPERICRAAATSAPHLRIVGIGSWGRSAVGEAISQLGPEVRFVDVLPAPLLRGEDLVREVRDSLMGHLQVRQTVYGDLGWAAGLFVRRALTTMGSTALASTTLRSLQLSATATAFGHGIAFGSDGSNLTGRKWLLEWRKGEVALVTEEPAWT